MADNLRVFLFVFLRLIRLNVCAVDSTRTVTTLRTNELVERIPGHSLYIMVMAIKCAQASFCGDVPNDSLVVNGTSNEAL